MESKGLKILVHASAFFAPFLVPVAVFLFATFLYPDDKDIRRLSIQALLFQLVMAVLITVSSFLVIFLIGIPMLIVFGIIGVAVPIWAIIKALNDEHFSYPIVGSWYY